MATGVTPNQAANAGTPSAVAAAAAAAGGAEAAAAALRAHGAGACACAYTTLSALDLIIYSPPPGADLDSPLAAEERALRADAAIRAGAIEGAAGALAYLVAQPEVVATAMAVHQGRVPPGVPREALFNIQTVLPLPCRALRVAGLCLQIAPPGPERAAVVARCRAARLAGVSAAVIAQAAGCDGLGNAADILETVVALLREEAPAPAEAAAEAAALAAAAAPEAPPHVCGMCGKAERDQREQAAATASGGSSGASSSSAAAARLLRCGGCKAVHYCSKRCQRIDWDGKHKEACAVLKKRAEAERVALKVVLGAR